MPCRIHFPSCSVSIKHSVLYALCLNTNPLVFLRLPCTWHLCPCSFSKGTPTYFHSDHLSPSQRAGNKSFCVVQIVLLTGLPGLLFFWGASNARTPLRVESMWVIVARKEHLRERRRNNNGVRGDLKVIQRLASRGLPTETAYRVATWGEATVHSQEWLSILFFSCALCLFDMQNIKGETNKL